MEGTILQGKKAMSDIRRLLHISTYIFIATIITLSSIAILPPKLVAAPATITVGTTDSIASLDPAKADDYFSVNVLQNIGDGLLRYVPGSTNLELAMATAYTVSPSGLNYTVAIRSGMKFANGDPINATTFQYSIIRARDMSGDPAYLLQGLVQSVAVINNTAFRVNLAYPFSVFPSLMAAWVTYPVDYKTQNYTGFNDRYAGSGPYTIQAYTPGVELDLMANPNYYGTAPIIPNVHIKFVSNSAALTTALESGSIDVAYRTFTPSDSQALLGMPQFTHWTGPGAVIRYLVLNFNMFPFNDTQIRKAVAYAINRTQITSQVFLNTVQNLYSMVPIGMWSHIDAWKTRYGADQNLTAAEAILSSKGYSSGHKLDINLWYTPSHYGSTEANVATLIAEQLAATGMIHVTLTPEDWPSMIDDFTHLRLPFFLLGWYPDYVDPDDYLYTFGTTAGTNSIGTNYQNKTMNDTAVAARVATTQPARTTLYEQMQTQMAIDNPEIPLWQGIAEAFTKNTVGGVIIDASTIFRYYLLTSSATVPVGPPLFLLILAPLLLGTAFVLRRKVWRT